MGHQILNLLIICRNCDELKKILNIKEKLQKVLDKYNALVIKNENFVEKNIENSSDEEELEEVKKEGYEDTVEFSDEDLPVASPLKQNQKKLESVEKNISKSHLPSSLSTTVDSFKGKF